MGSLRGAAVLSSCLTSPPENGREEIARANPGEGDARGPTGSQVHLMLLLLLEAVINCLVSLYIILLFFRGSETG